MKITAKICKKKSGTLKKLQKHFKELNDLKLKAGYFSDSGMHSTANMSYAQLMSLHEFGIDVPERPAIQIAGHLLFLGQNKDFKQAAKNLVGQVGKKNKNENILGEILKNQIHDIFGDPTKLQPNSRDKGRNTPLIDTEELLDNLGYKVNNKGVVK